MAKLGIREIGVLGRGLGMIKTIGYDDEWGTGLAKTIQVEGIVQVGRVKLCPLPPSDQVLQTLVHSRGRTDRLDRRLGSRSLNGSPLLPKCRPLHRQIPRVE